ncbi:hypothetical protein [Acetobacter pasteurianus]|uniref:hypothetical protein n=1 Tax=Acetobacter pasteurianus TaxID=438 RepID=UPI003D0B318A
MNLSPVVDAIWNGQMETQLCLLHVADVVQKLEVRASVHRVEMNVCVSSVIVMRWRNV